MDFIELLILIIILSALGFMYYKWINEDREEKIKKEKIESDRILELEKAKEEQERIRKAKEDAINHLNDFIKDRIGPRTIKDSKFIEFQMKGLPEDFYEMEFTAFDFETANKSDLSAISLGIAHFRGNKLLDVKEYKINPIMPLPWSFEHIHGISQEEAKTHPTFIDQWDEIEENLNGRLLVAHNADFDNEILKSTVHFYKKSLKNMRSACTYKLARRFMRYENSYSLENLCKTYNIPYGNHIASYDAVSAGVLFMKTITEAPYGATMETSMRGKKISIK